MLDFDLTTAINGAAGLCAAYLAVQIKAMLQALKSEVKDIRTDLTAVQARVVILEQRG